MVGRSSTEVAYYLTGKAQCAVLIVIGLLALLASYNIWMADISDPQCGLRPEFWMVTKKKRALLILLMYNLIPFISLCVCYSILIQQVHKARRNRVGTVTDNNKSNAVERLTGTVNTLNILPDTQTDFSFPFLKY